MYTLLEKTFHFYQPNAETLKMGEFYDICKSFDTERILLGIGGFYSTRIKPNFFINIINLFVWSITICQILATSVFVAKQISNFTESSEVLMFSATQYAFIAKILNYRSKSSNIIKLESLLSEDIFSIMDKEEQDIFIRYMRNAQKSVYTFRSLCASCVLVYGIFPQTDKSQPGVKIYPFPGSFPFNPDDYYYEVYIGEVVSVGVSAWINGTLDCLFTKLLSAATGLFAILENKIINFPDNVDKDEYIKTCAIYYDKLLKFVDILQYTFEGGIFFQFGFSCMVICLTLFQMLIIPFNSAQFILLVLYFSCMMCQISLYCWYGQLIMEKSNELTSAIYSTKWHEMDSKTAKMLLIIMERAKKPVYMQAYLFQLNVATLMRVVKTSYSYFAVLQRLYTKKE